MSSPSHYMRILQAKHFSLRQRNGLNTCVNEIMSELSNRGHDVRLVFGGEPSLLVRLCGLASGFGNRGLSRINLTRAIQWRLWWRTKALLMAWRPDVIHAHDVRTAVTLVPLSRALNIPIVLSQHGLLGTEVVAHGLSKEGGLYHIWTKNQERIAYHAAERILVVSSHMVDYIVSYGTPLEKVSVLPNGVSLPATTERLAPREGTFVCCGRLDPNKGFDLAIRALSLLIHQRGHSNARLVIIGDGPARYAWESVAREENVSHAVVFAGILSRSEAMRLMGEGLALVAPSVPRGGVIEGFPYVMLEAMSLRRPVIASDLGGFRDAIRSGETGFLVTPGEVGELANAMERFLVDPGLSGFMGEQAFRTVESQFSRAAIVHRLENIYGELVDPTRRGQRPAF